LQFSLLFFSLFHVFAFSLSTKQKLHSQKLPHTFYDERKDKEDKEDEEEDKDKDEVKKKKKKKRARRKEEDINNVSKSGATAS
jgi:hypothetical protein|tara:strand:- start:61 stop:309 length:249 start_codon:yes stop_codon:yes gene_type:complete